MKIHHSWRPFSLPQDHKVVMFIRSVWNLDTGHSIQNCYALAGRRPKFPWSVRAARFERPFFCTFKNTPCEISRHLLCRVAGINAQSETGVVPAWRTFSIIIYQPQWPAGNQRTEYVRRMRNAYYTCHLTTQNMSTHWIPSSFYRHTTEPLFSGPSLLHQPHHGHAYFSRPKKRHKAPSIQHHLTMETSKPVIFRFTFSGQVTGGPGYGRTLRAFQSEVDFESDLSRVQKLWKTLGVFGAWGGSISKQISNGLGWTKKKM